MRIMDSAVYVPLERLEESPTNPRKHFNEERLKELAASIQKEGILQPIVVRAIAGAGPERYEVVLGSCRLRAARIAELDTIPAILREMNDDQVIDIQLIENVQRQDLHPMEEAAGYHLLSKRGYDVGQIAHRVGRSRDYVYDRLRLMKLTKAAQTAFLEGLIPLGHAIMLARLSQDDQLRAIDPDEGGVYTTQAGFNFDFDEGDELEGYKPTSGKELQRWIDDHVKLEPTNKDIPQLFPAAAKALEQAKATDQKVVLITRSHHLQPEARVEKFIGPRSWRRADGMPDDDGQPTDRCDKAVMGFVFAGPGRGESFEICTAKKTCATHWADEQKAARQRAALTAKANTSRSKSSAPDPATARETAAQRLREEEARDRAEDLILTGILNQAQVLSMRQILEMVAADQYEAFGNRDIGKKYGMPERNYNNTDRVIAAVRKLGDAELGVMVVECMAIEGVSNYNNGGAVCAALGIPYKVRMKELQADILKELKAKAAAEKPATEKKPAKKKAASKAKSKKKK